MNSKHPHAARDIIRQANRRRLVRAVFGNDDTEIKTFAETAEGRKAALEWITQLQTQEEGPECIEIYELATELEVTRAWVAQHHAPDEQPDAGDEQPSPLLEDCRHG